MSSRNHKSYKREINLIFSHLDRNAAGTQYPEENFVFSDSFRTLLRTSGIESSF